MAVRLADLVALLHVREHIEVGFGIVVEHAPAGRRGVAEGFGDKGRIGQKPSESLRRSAPSAFACGSALSSARLSAQNSSSV